MHTSWIHGNPESYQLMLVIHYLKCLLICQMPGSSHSNLHCPSNSASFLSERYKYFMGGGGRYSLLFIFLHNENKFHHNFCTFPPSPSFYSMASSYPTRRPNSFFLTFTSASTSSPLIFI